MNLNVKPTHPTLLTSMMAAVFLITACGGGNVDDPAESTQEATTEAAMAVSPTSTDGTWTKKASEWGSFTLSTSTYVRYGYGTKWVGKWVTGKVSCNNNFFGSDPAYGYVKQCDVFQASPPSTAKPGSAILTWQAPLSSVTGYRVYYGTASGRYSQVLGAGVNVDAGSTTYTISNLTSGSTYYFAVTSVDSSGKESSFSNEASKRVD